MALPDMFYIPAPLLLRHLECIEEGDSCSAAIQEIVDYLRETNQYEYIITSGG